MINEMSEQINVFVSVILQLFNYNSDLMLMYFCDAKYISVMLNTFL